MCSASTRTAGRPVLRRLSRSRASRRVPKRTPAPLAKARASASGRGPRASAARRASTPGRSTGCSDGRSAARSRSAGSIAAAGASGTSGAAAWPRRWPEAGRTSVAKSSAAWRTCAALRGSGAALACGCSAAGIASSRKARSVNGSAPPSATAGPCPAAASSSAATTRQRNGQEGPSEGMGPSLRMVVQSPWRSWAHCSPNASSL